MKVLSVIAQKGGSGRTTVATSLAVAAQRAGLSVGIVDLDPQATACKWGDRRNADPVIVSTQPARLPNVLATAAANGADLMLIDTPPRAADAALAAAKAATLILIPCRAAVNDLETITTTMELIGSSRTKAHTAVLLNAVPPNGAERQQAEDVIRDLLIPVLPLAFGHRAAYRHAAALGKTAQEYDPKGKAAEEIEQLYKFVCKLMNSATLEQENTHGQTRLAAGAEA